MANQEMVFNLEVYMQAKIEKIYEHGRVIGLTDEQISMAIVKQACETCKGLFYGQSKESNDRCRMEGLPDWMYDDDDEPDKITKAKNEEKERITMEIMECNGDKLRAAKHLGYDINTFLQKIVEYNIY